MMKLRACVLVPMMLLAFAPLAFARDGLRTIKTSINDALDEARDADRACRDEAVDLIKDAKAVARDLRPGNKRDIDDLESALTKAIKRAKKACPKAVASSLEDALDAIDDLPTKDTGDAPKAEPKPPAEPTMQEIDNAKTACDKVARYQGDGKACLDAMLAILKGPHRGIALQVPESCSSTIANEFRFCMVAAAKSKRSPLEVNAFCKKNSRYLSDLKNCITEWSSAGSDADDGKAAAKKFLESCTTGEECSGGLCLKGSNGNYCSMACRVARDCQTAGGGRIGDWTCATTKQNTTGKSMCIRSGS